MNSDRYAQLFNLRPEEQAVFEGLDDKQKRLLTAYREAFLFTMGSRMVMTDYFIAFAKANADILEDFDPTNLEPPDYLLTIRAPKYHVGSGKPGSDDNAHKEIRLGWGSVTLGMVYDQIAPEFSFMDAVYKFLISYIQRDAELISGIIIQIDPDMGSTEKQTGRVSVEDKKASFVREIFLTNRIDAYVSEETLKIINVARTMLCEVIPFIKQILGKQDLDEQIRILAEKDLLQRYEEELGVTFQPDDPIFMQMHNANVFSRVYAGYLDYLKVVFPELASLTHEQMRLIKELLKLINTWAMSHEGEAFIA